MLQLWGFISLGYCLNLVSGAIIDTLTKRNLGRKEFILSYRIESIIKRSQGRNMSRKLEAGTEAETRGMLLTDLLPWLAQLPLWDTCPVMVPPTSITNQENGPHRLAAGQSDDCRSSVEVPSSRVT